MQSIRLTQPLNISNMLTKLHVKNYKAFTDSSVKIRPITVLLGANSVGKSSIIQLLLTLQQTAQENKSSYKSALKIYGSSVNLGSTENLFHKKNIEEPVEIEISIRNSMFLSKQKEAIKKLANDIQAYINIFPILGFNKLRGKELHTKAEIIDYIKEIKEIINKEHVKSYRDRFYYYNLRASSITLGNLIDSTSKQLDDFFDFLYSMTQLDSDEFTYNYKVSFVDKTRLKIVGLSIRNSNKTIVSITNTGNDKYTFSSDFVKLSNDEDIGIESYFKELSTLFSCIIEPKEVSTEKINNIIFPYLYEYAASAIHCLLAEFETSKMNYVSPLRAHPKRYYMLDKAKVALSLDTLDGDAIAEILKENASLKNSVNKWLSKFGFSVDVETLKEVIHNVKIKQNGLSLDITDVGFGISQVLPVIIQGFLSPNDSMTIVEQPEIHLHPKMQAELADLFIEVAKKKKKQIIIETHSEYLLKRLRRRISEGNIPPEDVSICLFHPQIRENGAYIENLDIAQKGFFEWPEDFYDGELSKDITEFLKNQI